MAWSLGFYPSQKYSLEWQELDFLAKSPLIHWAWRKSPSDMNQGKKVHSHPESFQETRSSLIAVNKETHLSPAHWMSPFVSPKGSSYILSLLLQKVQVPQNWALRGRGVLIQTYLSTFSRETGPEMAGHRGKGRSMLVAAKVWRQECLLCNCFQTYLPVNTYVPLKRKRERMEPASGCCRTGVVNLPVSWQICTDASSSVPGTIQGTENS